jgi:phosphoserine aminotransferase
MVKRIYNFSSGPAVLPLPVLEEAREALLSLGDTGIGILEHSHRGKAFLNVYNETVALFREVGRIPDDYEILFLQGGASTQFFMIPMNLLAKDQTADYLVTGAWSEKAVGEAKLFGNTHVAGTSKDRNFCYIPKTRTYSSKPAYVHFTSNNTIFGTEFFEEPAVPPGTPLICDASSDIFSRPLDIKRYGVIYAGAQKNLGPAGTTLVIIRKDLIERGPKDLPTMLQYRTHASNESMYNTCPTFGIYVMGLVVKWIKSQGGIVALETRNKAKADKLYAYLDSSRLFKATADRDSRSRMNVTFVTGKEELDNEFVKFAEKQGLDGLKGHRSVGGMRASLYNAFPAEGVDALIDAMKRFESQHA